MDGLVWSPIIIEVTLTSKKLEQYCVHGKQLFMFACGVDMQSSGGSLNETKARAGQGGSLKAKLGASFAKCRERREPTILVQRPNFFGGPINLDLSMMA